MAPLLAHHAIDGAIGGFPVGFAVQGYPDRKTAGCIVSDDLDAANGLAAGPLSNGLQTLLSEGSVAQPERRRLCQMMRPTADMAKRYSSLDLHVSAPVQYSTSKNRPVRPGGSCIFETGEAGRLIRRCQSAATTIRRVGAGSPRPAEPAAGRGQGPAPVRRAGCG